MCFIGCYALLCAATSSCFARSTVSMLHCSCSARVQMLPADLHEEWEQDPAMATHLLAAADMYQLGRLARICDQRLCRSIDVDNAAHLLALAEQHQAHVGTRF